MSSLIVPPNQYLESEAVMDGMTCVACGANITVQLWRGVGGVPDTMNAFCTGTPHPEHFWFAANLNLDNEEAMKEAIKLLKREYKKRRGIIKS